MAKKKNKTYIRETPQERLKKETKKKKHKRFWFKIKLLLLFMLLAVLTVLVVFYVKYGDDLLKWKLEADRAVEASTTDTFRSSETSMIYASNKSVIAKLKGDKDSYYLSYEEIPQSVKDAFIVTEDRDFFSHEGINFLSTMKAAVLLIESKIKGEDPSRGGSTITQQLVRNVFITQEQTYERKFREMFYAMAMEKKYSKEQILEFYINNIYFASGYYGIEAAARGYFSKSVSELDLAELVFLCAIPNSPNRYNPLENFDNTMERKGRILSQMLEAELIGAAEYSDATYQDIILDPADAVKTQNYLTTYAMNCAAKALMEKQGFEFRYKFSTSADREEYEEEYDELFNECYDSLYTGGYQIYTSLNKKKQKKLQKAVNEQLAMYKEKSDGVYKLQGAATCIDNDTGFVVAIVGGRKQKSLTGYTLNRAYQSYRQPGSCFKPLVVYTPQLERGYTPDTIVDDTYFKDGPKNSGNSYSGKVPLRYAVERSKNVIAWKLFDELTPSTGLSYVQNMNFANIVSSDYVLAASLGGLTNGVTTVEMASAYATIENDGVYRAATCIKKITDSEGNVIVNYNKKRKTKKVYEESAARMMTDILEGVLVSGTAAGNALDNMACAGKTGTTSDQKDGWFCGFTPYYTTTVWVGYDQPKEMSDLYGSTYPLRIWRQFMSEIHANLPNKAFETYKEESSGGGYQNQDDEPEATTETTPKETIDPEADDKKDKDEEKKPEEAKETSEPKKTPEPTATPAPTATPVTSQESETDNENPEDVGDNENPEDVGGESEVSP